MGLEGVDLETEMTSVFVSGANRMMLADGRELTIKFGLGVDFEVVGDERRCGIFKSGWGRLAFCACLASRLLR